MSGDRPTPLVLICRGECPKLGHHLGRCPNSFFSVLSEDSRGTWRYNLTIATASQASAAERLIALLPEGDGAKCAALMRDSRSCRRIQQSMGIRSGQRSGVSLIVAAFVGNLTDKTQATGV